uniref:Uncharacterized protein n=1 Tax=Anguilla anguilla TaxID=7936 RepID=A0A0E9SJR2_ANGAN
MVLQYLLRIKYLH